MFLVDVTHAVKIRRGKESLVYRCDKMADKKNLLSSFKLASEELASRKRKEREGEHERRRSMWAGATGDVRIYEFPTFSQI